MPVLADFTICAFYGRFFFALLSLSRISVTLGFIDRPLFAGIVCSLCLGDFSLATSVIMPVAIFYEILWIDLFPAGTYVPPNGTLSFLLVFCIAYALGISSENALTPSDLLIPMILAMPAATCASRIEMYLRHLNDTRYDKLARWLGQGDSAMAQNHQEKERRGVGTADAEVGVYFSAATACAPHTLILSSLLQSLLIYMITFMACLFVLFVTFWCLNAILGSFQGDFIFFDESAHIILTWPMLWFAALLGGLLALRIKKAYFAYVITVCALFLSFFFLK